MSRGLDLPYVLFLENGMAISGRMVIRVALGLAAAVFAKH